MGATVTVRRQSKVTPRVSRYLEVTRPRRTFWTGAARLWDFSGALTPQVAVKRVPRGKTVAEALAEDWAAVGNDIRAVMSTYGDSSNGNVA